MFNSRIEIFNNLLYMDVETYNYALVLDSNLNLHYTNDTYNQRFGTLNNKGQKIILSDLQDLIQSISLLNAVHLEVDSFQKKQQTWIDTKEQNNSQFFL